MPSLLPDFEYDIFISYRQKDNRGDHWVTEFVTALKTEIEATFKEDISIYFDENPHDGLLETHNVDKSLEGKLKCLIFIPIISQTYCDPKCFAWQNEFVAFNNLAKADSLGRDIKLVSGNVAGRILPIKIHELDAEDKALIEGELGGVLRSVDFIYKSAGVNRPLRAHEDHPQDNLNKTYYRDQINKVANSIKEIIGSLKAKDQGGTLPARKPVIADVPTPRSSTRKWIAVASGLALVLLGVLYFLYIQNFSVLKDPGSSGVAVLPFRNNTGSEDFNYYGVGMASEIRTKLSMSKKFSFISSLQATLPYVDTKKSPKEIGSELGVDYLLSGLYQKSGKKIKVNVELIDASTGHTVWTLPLENELADIFDVQASIAGKVLQQFSSVVETQENAKASTKNLVAYAQYTRGIELSQNPKTEFWSTAKIFQPAIDQFEKAVQLDSTYVDAWAALIDANCYVYVNEPDSIRKGKIKKYVDFVNSHFPDSWTKKFAQGQYSYRVLHDFDRGLELMLQVLEEDPNNVSAASAISGIYRRKLDFGHAIVYAVKAVNLDPGHSQRWVNIADIMRSMGDDTNCLKAELKAWDLSHSKRDARVVLNAAICGKYSLDQLPDALKNELGPEFIQAKYNVSRNWTLYKKIALSEKDYPAICYTYWLLGKKDSCKYWAEIGLKENKISGSFYFAMIGDRQKAFSDIANFYRSYGEMSDDREQTCQLKFEYLWTHVQFDEYKAVTDTLINLNNEFPEYGAYGVFNTPWFDRIKKEYPPFQEAINNLKRKPMIEISKSIKL